MAKLSFIIDDDVPEVNPVAPAAEKPKLSFIIDDDAAAPVAQAPAPAPKEEPGWFMPGSKSEAVVRGFSNAATLGFGDEIQAGIRSIFGQGDYSTLRDEQRAANKAAQEANPGSYLAGSAAAIAPTLAAGAPNLAMTGGREAGRFAKATALDKLARVGESIARPAVQGGAYGGVAGLGNAEGTAAEQLSEAGQGALLGGAIGAGAGALSTGAKFAGNSSGRELRTAAGIQGKPAVTEAQKQALEQINKVEPMSAAVRSGIAQGKDVIESMKKVGGAVILEPVTSAKYVAAQVLRKAVPDSLKEVVRGYNRQGGGAPQVRALIERGAPFAAIDAVLQESDPDYRNKVLQEREEEQGSTARSPEEQ